MFLGIISPNTTCRKVTSARAIANAITLMASGVNPVRPSGISSRW
jgi:hypothetical protein